MTDRLARAAGPTGAGRIRATEPITALEPVTVESGQDVSLTLDFDVSKSFVVQGNPNTPAGIKGFLMKPTVVLKGVQENGGEVVPVCAGIEAEIAQLDETDRAEFLAELGMSESGLALVLLGTPGILESAGVLCPPRLLLTAPGSVPGSGQSTL